VWTRVSACARLHFGLFNMSGVRNRVDGGAGVALDAPACRITIREGNPWVNFSGPVSDGMADAIQGTIARFCSKFGLPTFQLIVDQDIPEHAGLGSKTACLMALAHAVSEHFDLELGYIDLASLINRGGTSGVGVHVSQFGGIVVDGGHEYPGEKPSFVPSSASTALPAPLLEHHAPPDRCAVTHLRLEPQGLSGAVEKEFFQLHCPIPRDETLRLLSMVEDVLLPGIRNRSIAQINDGLCALQHLGMKAREWGIQGPITKTLRDRWEELRARRSKAPLPPMCLSSMGPTVFMLSDDPESIVFELSKLGISPDTISIAQPNHSGNLVEVGN
jgi:beta-ribofuranosylaminobenzene 5'-phosphate synthase